MDLSIAPNLSLSNVSGNMGRIDWNQQHKTFKRLTSVCVLWFFHYNLLNFLTRHLLNFNINGSFKRRTHKQPCVLHLYETNKIKPILPNNDIKLLRISACNATVSLLSVTLHMHLENRVQLIRLQHWQIIFPSSCVYYLTHSVIDDCM